MKTCPQCARSYPDSEQFCADDGTALGGNIQAKARITEFVKPSELEAPSGIACAVCGGKALSPEEEICAFCGARLHAPQAAAAAPSSVRPAPAPRSAEPPRHQTFDDEPMTPTTERTSSRRHLGAIGYTLAAIAALAAGVWFALHLSAKHAEQANIAPETPAAVEPVVAIATNPPPQVTGESASNPARNIDSVKKLFEDNKSVLLDRYKQALEGDKTLGDGMLVTLRVAPTGEVASGAVKTSTNLNPSLDSGVIKDMMGWHFAPFSGGLVDVDYPIVFAPNASEQAKIEAQLADKVAHRSPTELPEYASAPGPAVSPAATPSAAPSVVASVPTVEIAPSPVALEPAPTVVTPKKPGKRKTDLAAVKPPKPSLLQRVEERLHRHKELTGAKAYTSGSVVTLYGKVFDDRAKSMAASVARKVEGVSDVVNTLTTETALWSERENNINRELRNAGLGKVTVKVIGKDAYLDGEVESDAQRERAVTIAETAAPVKVRTNLIRVAPKSMFGF